MAAALTADEKVSPAGIGSANGFPLPGGGPDVVPGSSTAVRKRGDRKAFGSAMRITAYLGESERVAVARGVSVSVPEALVPAVPEVGEMDNQSLPVRIDAFQFTSDPGSP